MSLNTSNRLLLNSHGNSYERHWSKNAENWDHYVRGPRSVREPCVYRNVCYVQCGMCDGAFARPCRIEVGPSYPRRWGIAWQIGRGRIT